MQCLPNSNQGRRFIISQPDQTGITQGEGSAQPINRREIPPSATESVWKAADGHAIRRIDWPGADFAADGAVRGSILFFPGRGDNYEKYLEMLEQWHRAGWRVTSADWRGQAASGRLGDDAVTGHIGDFADWIGDLAAFWNEWKAATPGPHILSGHSMGGHLVLRGVADSVVDPDALVLCAPMLGFVGEKLPDGLLHGAAKMMAAFRGRTTPAWKWSEKPGEVPLSRANLLTHDADRYEDEQFWRRERPALVMGPGSWGWVERAYASMRGLFVAGKLEAVKIPVLLISTSNDKLVSHSANLRAAGRLPDVELLAFGKEARHEILREEDEVRDRAMGAISAFLGRVTSRK